MTRSRLDVIEQRNFARKQFLWLRQVVSDPTLPPMAAKVAIALTRYFNRETGVAYPGMTPWRRNLASRTERSGPPFRR